MILYTFISNNPVATEYTVSMKGPEHPKIVFGRVECADYENLGCQADIPEVFEKRVGEDQNAVLTYTIFLKQINQNIFQF